MKYELGAALRKIMLNHYFNKAIIITNTIIYDLKLFWKSTHLIELQLKMEKLNATTANWRG